MNLKNSWMQNTVWYPLGMSVLAYFVGQCLTGNWAVGMTFAIVAVLLGEKLNTTKFKSLNADIIHFLAGFTWVLLLHKHISFYFIGLALAGLKEFGYDATFEINPPQGFKDNVRDFAGYGTGLFVGLLFETFVVRGF